MSWVALWHANATHRPCQHTRAQIVTVARLHSLGNRFQDGNTKKKCRRLICGNPVQRLCWHVLAKNHKRRFPKIFQVKDHLRR